MAISKLKILNKIEFNHYYLFFNCYIINCCCYKYKIM